MRQLLREIEDDLARFGKMRDEAMGDGRDDSQDGDWKLQAQYLQGRVESLQDVKKKILVRLGDGEQEVQKGVAP